MTMLSNARHHFLLNLLALAVGVVMLVPSVAYADTNGGIGARPAHSDPDNHRTESIFI